MSSAVFAPLIILTSCLVSLGSSDGQRLKVIAGDTIDFQCVTERGEADNVEYLPNFERINDDGSWTTLFVGANPRPGTELSKWLVSVDEESVFHYRLLSASLADGGHYRCENVNTFHHPLNVFAPVLDCGESLPEVDDVDAFRPVCRVETSGPEAEEDAADSPSTLKWVVDGAEDGDVKSATTTNSSFLEAMLTEGLTEEHHGKSISCVLDAGIRREVENPNCVLGPLNISFNVKVKSISESRADDCQRFDLVLTGNPKPMLQFVTVEDPSGIVESGISYSTTSGSSSGDVDVHLRACDLESNIVALVHYEGVLVTSVEFVAGDGVEEAPVVSTSDSSPVIAAVVVVIVLLIAVAAGVAFYFHRRKQTAKPVDDVEAQEKEVEEEKVEEEEKKEDEKKEEDEKNKEEVEKVEGEKTEDDKVEEDKVEDEKKEVKEGLETAVVVDAEAEADSDLKDKLAEVEGESDAALKAKLSVLEDVEGVKMIDDSLNEGKEDTPGADKENVDV